MSWYYATGGERKGPVENDEFERLNREGVITAETLVWRDGMANWQPRRQVVTAGNTPAGMIVCRACQRAVPEKESFLLLDAPYCGACKPQILQRIHEGQPLPISNAEQTRNTYLKHEASVKSIGLLYYIGGTILSLAGIFMVIGLMAGPGKPENIVIALVCLVLAAIQISLGVGLRRLKAWVRIPTGILAAIGLLGFPLGTLINGYILYLICSEKGTMVFSPAYREVIALTPHIRYKTSIVVWVLLGLVLLLIAIGVVAAVFGKH
jgi:hypothetical protein